MTTEIPDFDGVPVTVVGDVMLDQYWYGGTTRISPEAPVPVVRVDGVEERPGGAANVALNLAALGATPFLLGVVGHDEAADRLEEHLTAAGVECDFERVAEFSTTTKLRVVSAHQQLIRLDTEMEVPPQAAKQLARRAMAATPRASVVIYSDYAKGALAEVQQLIRYGRSADCRLLVDPKGRDFRKYRGASVLTPNAAEFQAVVGPFRDEATLAVRAADLARDLSLEAILVTRGEHGMTLLRPGADEFHVPARTQEVFDVTGAGDTVIATFAAVLAAGGQLTSATVLSNLAAGCVVSKLGTAVVTPTELRSAEMEASGRGGIVDEEQLAVAVGNARARGKRLVMTNGCFDILHAGHVSYLSAARKLGDRLVVAVNDDDSVRRLKGPGRPVNNLARRMSVLAALKCVDWVVPFSEDTPERLIRRLRPDVLAKGGDYRPEEIAGHDAVVRSGGEVRVLQYVPGLSSSELIRSYSDTPKDGE